MNIEWHPNIPYVQAHELMKTRMLERIEDNIQDTLLLCTHPPVYTLGRQKGASNNLINVGDIPCVNVERGGNVTFHGPGQLVGYPILKLPEHKHDIHAFLRFLESFWIRFLTKWNIEANRDDRNTGVWVNDKKIVAIGVAFRRWVSWHGFALNIDVDLSYYQRINPCGMSSALVTRLCDHTDEKIIVSKLQKEVGIDFFAQWEQWKI